jgi:predicted phosphodiesterase
MAVYICGDTHGDLDWSKLNSKNFKGTKNDFVIVLGDFGGVWDCGKSDAYIQKWYNEKPWTTLFVDGNHENHDVLDAMPVSEWHGGKVHKISEKIIHLMRGQVYEIEGKTFFVMGGAASHDKIYRKEGISWWAREMPSEDEYEEGFKNLQAHEHKVDYVLAHCAPDGLQAIIGGGYYEHDRLTNYLEVTCMSIKFSDFYCGHYHCDRDYGKYHVLYQRVIKIET